MPLLQSHYDAIVVGLGGVGSFALRALAKEATTIGSATPHHLRHRSSRYLGIELGSLMAVNANATCIQRGSGTHMDISSSASYSDKTVHPRKNIPAGFSSRGLTRIYRRAYFEHPNYVPWIDHSLTVFREMEASSGLSLMKECGVLLIEPFPSPNGNNTPNTQNGPSQQMTLLQELPPLVTASLNSARLHNVPVELLNVDQLKQQFPQFNYHNHNMVGLLEPGGGLLRPERIMNVALEEAVSSDTVDIIDNTAVSYIRDNEQNNIVEIQLSQRNNNGSNGKPNQVTTNKLLICTGAWTGTLIPNWDSFLHPVRQVQGWIDTNVGNCRPFHNMFGSEHMPAFLYLSPDWPEALYGVPGDENVDDRTDHSTSRHSWLKVGIHKQDISKSSHLPINEHHGSIASSEEILELQRVIPLCINELAWADSKSLPTRMQPQLIDTKPCMYTMTPDKHFVIGEVSKNVFGVAGLSGHGFKMTPTLGQIMADYAFGRDVSSKWNTDFCSPNRFI